MLEKAPVRNIRYRRKLVKAVFEKAPARSTELVDGQMQRQGCVLEKVPAEKTVVGWNEGCVGRKSAGRNTS